MTGFRQSFRYRSVRGPMPVRPVEVMIAKIVPYIGIGYVQVRLILAVSVAVFQLLIRGSIGLLILALGLFIASNLAFGFTISTLAGNQMPGDPASTVHAFAVDPAVGLSLPVPRLADLGAIDRQGVPDDAHPTVRPRYHLKGNTGAEIYPTCGRSRSSR
jgi:ABC-2 type transport system permease protein